VLDPAGVPCVAHCRVGAHAADALARARRPHRDAFAIDQRVDSTDDLDGHRAASDLDELAPDDEPEAEAA
jgi:hypothetical protein